MGPAAPQDVGNGSWLETTRVRRPASLRSSAAALAILIVAGLVPYGPLSGGAAIVNSGRAVAHRDRGQGATATPGKVPRAVLHRTGFPGAEPTLGAAQDGTVFTVSWVPSDQVDVLRFSDDGAMWERISPQLPGGENIHQASFDPYIYFDEDGGRLFTVDLLIACSYLSFSDDHGDTWTTNPLACGQPFNDHQSVFSGPPVTSSTTGYPEVVYYCFADFGNKGSFCSRSLDGGLSFLPPAGKAYPSERNGRFCGGLHGHGTSDQDGNIYLPANHCGHPFVAISKDEGETWERARVSRLRHINGPDPAAAVDRRGNLYYVWIGPRRMPYLSVSRDGGKRWSKPVMIAAPGLTETAHVTVAAGDAGKIAFAYMGSRNSRYARCAGQERCSPPYGGVTWDGYIGLTTNALAPDPLFHSAAVNRRANPLVEGSCGPRRCDQLLDFMDVIIAPDGTPWASFVDTVGGDVDNEAVIGRLVGGPALR